MTELEMINTIGDLKSKINVYEEMLRRAKLILTQEKYSDDTAVQDLICWMNDAGVKSYG